MRAGAVRAASAAAWAAPCPAAVVAGAAGVSFDTACGMLRVAPRGGGGVGSGTDLRLAAAGRFATFGAGAVRAGGGGTLDWRWGAGGGADERASPIDAPGPEGGHSEEGRSAASEAVPSVTALLTWIT